MNKQKLKSQIFTCPNCDQSFEINEFLEHSENANKFNEFVEKKFEENISVINKNLASEKELAVKNAILQSESVATKQIEQLKNQIDKLSSEKELAVENAILQSESVATKQIEQLKNQIDKLSLEKELAVENAILQSESSSIKQIEQLKNQIDKLSSEKELAVENAISDVTSKLSIERETQKDKYLEIIKQLEIANATNRLINNKVKGENFEFEIEQELNKAFRECDDISKITTGDQKADFLQVVKTGKETIGKIVYEVKNANWSNKWVPKLNQDMINKKGDYGILVASSFNDEYKGVPFIKSNEFENIWITGAEGFVFVGQIIRKLIENKHKFESLEKRLLKEGGVSEELKILKNQKEMLEKFIINKVPNFIKDFNNQMKTLETVSKNLSTQSNNIDKVRDILIRKFDKLIIRELEKLNGGSIKSNLQLDDDLDIDDL